MRKVLLLSLVLLTGACSFMSRVGEPEARIIRQDGDHIVLYNSTGSIKPAAALVVARKYCAAVGKTAELESRGGTPYDCVSNQLGYCLTYVCKPAADK
jgi:hypothetical protein